MSEEIMKNHEQFVESNITKADNRKKDLLRELGSLRSSSVTSSSSSAVRLRARAEAAAAMKKIEMQKRRSAIESQSALMIQQEELALAQRKMEERARIESLRLDEEAAIAVAKANAIDDELNHVADQKPSQFSDIPEKNASHKMQRYFNELQKNQKVVYGKPPSRATQQRQLDPQPHPLNPAAAVFNPPRREENSMKSYLDFLARQELVANKVPKFDDRPETIEL